MIYEWLLIAILAYIFFGFASLGDKLVLSGKPKAKTYTFYMSVLGLFVIFFIPFINFGFPNPVGMIWIVLDALVRILAIYTMFVALEKFDVSRVIPTIGAIQPIFIFILTWIFWGPQSLLGIEILAFVLLFVGSIIISFEKNIKLTGSYLLITIFSSLMFSLDYIFAKSVFLNQPFLQGVIWTGIFIFIFALVFILTKKSRAEIFSKSLVVDKKTQLTFIGTQTCGGLASILQAFAISLAPVAFLPIVNSLKGIQYIFLFVITLFLSVFFPNILKEELSRKVVIRKIVSIIFIALGLVILVIK